MRARRSWELFTMLPPHARKAGDWEPMQPPTLTQTPNVAHAKMAGFMCLARMALGAPGAPVPPVSNAQQHP